MRCAIKDLFFFVIWGKCCETEAFIVLDEDSLYRMYSELEKHISRFVFEHNTLHQDQRMQKTSTEAIGNNYSKDNNCEMLVMVLSYLTDFDVELQISSPNMCLHDKRCAKGEKSTYSLAHNVPMMFYNGDRIKRKWGQWKETDSVKLLYSLVIHVVLERCLWKMCLLPSMSIYSSQRASRLIVHSQMQKRNSKPIGYSDSPVF